MYPKGTIVLIPFPFTDLSGQKVRPAAILACPKGGEDCIVSFITSLQPSSRFCVTLPFITAKETGLKSDSWLRLDKIATLTHRSIIGKIGKMPSTLLVEANTVLLKLFAI